MKPVHWFNLILVGSLAAAVTYFAYRWGVTSYADPTCRAYAASRGLTYLGYTPPDWNNSNTGSSHLGRDGDCELTNTIGEDKSVTLVTVSGPSYGAPILVSFALRPDIICIFSFIGIAFVLVVITRPFKRR